MAIVPLPKSKYAIVDTGIQEFLLQWKWACTQDRNTWYAHRKRNKHDTPGSHHIYMHHVVLEFFNVEMPEGYVTDHKNRNGLDNRIFNLRPVTVAQNALNAIRRRSKSGYTGVRWDTNKGLWRAYLTVDGAEKFICYCDDAKTAAIYRDKAVLSLYNDAGLNFPEYREAYIKGVNPNTLPAYKPEEEYVLTVADKKLIDEYTHLSNNNTSGYVGVYPSSHKVPRWVAQGTGNIYIGCYDTPLEAHIARKWWMAEREARANHNPHHILSRRLNEKEDGRNEG